MNVTEEARQLNVKIEKEPDGSFVAALDDEMVLPGETPEEVILEARAFRAIEQSELYLVNYNETKDEYEVTFANDDLKMVFADKHLHKAYEMAQAHYATQFKVEAPEPPVEEPKPNGAGRRTRKAKLAQTVPAIEPAQPTPEPTVPTYTFEPHADRLAEIMTHLIEAQTKMTATLEIILTIMKEKK